MYTAFNSRAAPFLLASIGLVLHRGGVEVRSEKLVGTGMGWMVSREGSKTGVLEKHNPLLDKLLGTLLSDQQQ